MPNASDCPEYTSSMRPGTIPSPCHRACWQYMIQEKVLKFAMSTDASLHVMTGWPVVNDWLRVSCLEWHTIV